MTRIPTTLSMYLGKQFLSGILLIFGILTALVTIFDALEIIRRGLAKDVPYALIIEMVFMRIPYQAQRILPFAILLGGILSFAKLTRTSELVVARASGVSVWQFLLPAFATSFILGTFITTVFNPLSSSMLRRFEQIEAKYLKGTTSMLAISSSGLWLRQANDYKTGKTVIHALRVSQNEMKLFEVSVFIFGNNNEFLERIDAPTATLEDGYWLIERPILSQPGSPSRQRRQYKLPTTLSVHKIQESFVTPETMSFWELPTFIKTIREAGFSPLRHLLYWHTHITKPFLFCAMVFIAAAFSLRPPRQGKTGMLMGFGILTGFTIYFLTDLTGALGLSGRIPVALAAWAPVGISMLIGAAVMLHMEDG